MRWPMKPSDFDPDFDPNNALPPELQGKSCPTCGVNAEIVRSASKGLTDSIMKMREVRIQGMELKGKVDESFRRYEGMRRQALLLLALNGGVSAAWLFAYFLGWLTR